MPTIPDESVPTIRQRLLDSMIDFMHADEGEPDDEWDCGYSRQDVDRCAKIIDGYLNEIASGKTLTQEQIRATVKETLLELNALNDLCDGSLIETEQREDLCSLIFVAAKNAGFDFDEDITAEWREW